MKTLAKDTATSSKIRHLAGTVRQRLQESVEHIQEVNDDIHVLSINAKIEAARAGNVGRGFHVVANEVGKMVARTQTITEGLTKSVAETIGELMEINDLLETKVRGERLGQMAFNAIDIIDRNLYERSCDVRWWATEDSLVEALTSKDPQRIRFASRRLGVILDSYTVYQDLILCNAAGRVIAQGRPEKFNSIGRSIADQDWFRSALNSASGNEFGFQSVHSSILADGQQVLIYSCAVRESGDVQGKILGVLGIVFHWGNLGLTVVQRAEEILSHETEHPVRCLILDRAGRILTSTNPAEVLTVGPLSAERLARLGAQGFTMTNVGQGSGKLLQGFACSQGFETYRTNWVALIEEDQTDNGK